jgi:CheY-like chemotaxis protein
MSRRGATQMAAVAMDRPELLEDTDALLLFAGEDAGTVVALAGERLESPAVVEAADGAEALQIGLRRSPQIALLDAEMPVLDGIVVGAALRNLQPELRLALLTDDPRARSLRPGHHGLPLFDRADVGQLLAWLELQVRAVLGERRR